jgi:hypothetical protein
MCVLVFQQPNDATSYLGTLLSERGEARHTFAKRQGRGTRI